MPSFVWDEQESIARYESALRSRARPTMTTTTAYPARNVCGLIVPYDRRTVGPIPFANRVNQGAPIWQAYYEIVDEGAFKPAALEADLTEFRVGHRGQALPIVGGIQLVAFRHGVFGNFRLVPGAQAEELFASRAGWTGFSVSFDRRELESQWDEHTRTIYVRRVDWLNHIALATGDERPAYAETWAMADFKGALQRMAADEDRHLRAEYGSNYRSWHRDLWDSPPQAKRLEQKLRAISPGRRIHDWDDILRWM